MDGRFMAFSASGTCIVQEIYRKHDTIYLLGMTTYSSIINFYKLDWILNRN
jgi:hypothetical protein